MKACRLLLSALMEYVSANKLIDRESLARISVRPSALGSVFPISRCAIGPRQSPLSNPKVMLQSRLGIVMLFVESLWERGVGRPFLADPSCASASEDGQPGMTG